MNTLKGCLRSPNQHLCMAALSTITVLYVFLTENKLPNTYQELTTLRQYLNIFLPAAGIIEKLGDAKEKVREKAQQTLFTIGSLVVKAGNLSSIQSSKGKDSKVSETSFQVFERLIREQGLNSKNWRVREQVCALSCSISNGNSRCYQTIMTLVQLRRVHKSLPLKPFLSGLVDSLESSDGTVRECAKQAIIEMFTGANVSDTAKSELKKEMTKKNVRKTILDTVLFKIFNPETENGTRGSEGVGGVDSKNDDIVSKPSLAANPSQPMVLGLETPPNQTNTFTSEITPVYVSKYLSSSEKK